MLRTIRRWQGRAFVAECCLGPGCGSDDASRHCSEFSSLFPPTSALFHPILRRGRDPSSVGRIMECCKQVFLSNLLLLPGSIDQASSGAQLSAFKQQE